MDICDTRNYRNVPPETWDAKTCERAAKRRFVDGYGTRSHLPGLHVFMKSGPERFNGGSVYEGKWYPGVIHNLPVLAKGFKWIMVPTWGWRIVKEGDKTMDLSKYKITTEIVNAPQMKKWITERNGIVRWASIDLSDPGAGMLGPRIGPDGKPTTKPSWKMGNEPEFHVTDPEEVGILTEKEFKTVRIGIKRGSGFMQMVLTDSATRRVREAMNEAGRVPGTSLISITTTVGSPGS